jgi:hypothetical protein
VCSLANGQGGTAWLLGLRVNQRLVFQGGCADRAIFTSTCRAGMEIPPFFVEQPLHSIAFFAPASTYYVHSMYVQETTTHHYRWITRNWDPNPFSTHDVSTLLEGTDLLVDGNAIMMNLLKRLPVLACLDVSTVHGDQIQPSYSAQGQVTICLPLPWYSQRDFLSSQACIFHGFYKQEIMWLVMLFTHDVCVGGDQCNIKDRSVRISFLSFLCGCFLFPRACGDK